MLSEEGRPTFVDTVNLPEEILQGCDVRTFSGKNKNGEKYTFGWRWKSIQIFCGFVKSIISCHG